MKIVTESGTLVCEHELGNVAIKRSQSFVRINRSPVLVAHDPVGKAIAGCPNTGGPIKPCTSTLAVYQGYSSWISINGKKICLDDLEGKTDGTPPGAVKYKVRNTGQNFVEQQ